MPTTKHTPVSLRNMFTISEMDARQVNRYEVFKNFVERFVKQTENKTLNKSHFVYPRPPRDKGGWCGNRPAIRFVSFTRPEKGPFSLPPQRKQYKQRMLCKGCFSSFPLCNRCLTRVAWPIPTVVRIRDPMRCFPACLWKKISSRVSEAVFSVSAIYFWWSNFSRRVYDEATRTLYTCIHVVYMYTHCMRIHVYVCT